jgi:hypothetical protein
MIWAILATGPSMSQAVADSVRGRCSVVAVSDAYKLAPWADALVSSDLKWWRHHQPDFPGAKYAAVEVAGVKRFDWTSTDTNSGLLGIKVAVNLGATRVLLLGFDMGGTHFFGKHPSPLRNTSDERFEVFKKQFADYRPRGVEIINCTPGSALKCYPMARLEDVLCQ